MLAHFSACRRQPALPSARLNTPALQHRPCSLHDDGAAHAVAVLAAVEGAVVAVGSGLRELLAEGLARTERGRLERAVVGGDGVGGLAVVLPRDGRPGLDRDLLRLKLEVLDTHTCRRVFGADTSPGGQRREESEEERDERDRCCLPHFNSLLTCRLRISECGMRIEEEGHAMSLIRNPKSALRNPEAFTSCSCRRTALPSSACR